MGRSALNLAVSSITVIVIGLVTGWGVAEWLSLVAGLWVGLFLMWGALRLFDWGRSAARSIYLWGIVGMVLVVLVVLVEVGTMMSGVMPATPAVTITFWTAGGIVLGAVSTAGGMSRRLRDENGSP